MSKFSYTPCLRKGISSDTGESELLPSGETKHMFIVMDEKPVNEFGGNWTANKLHALREYLIQYMKIFTVSTKASYYKTIYFDAFAGGGFSSEKKGQSITPELFDKTELTEVKQFRKGSPLIALDIPRPFDVYIFNDNDPEAVSSLENLRSDHRLRDRIKITRDEANKSVIEFCNNTDWARCRAVLFLDPYGAQVNWTTLEHVADTKAIDMWLLFPLGQAVVRMLTKNEPPPDHWASCLTRLFGTDEWRTKFYSASNPQRDLFGEAGPERRCCDLDDVARYFVLRLKSIFAGVVEKPKYLTNSKMNPIFMLCFAAGNKKGAIPALRIAAYLTGDQ